jgi:hypothetical protein
MGSGYVGGATNTTNEPENTISQAGAASIGVGGTTIKGPAAIGANAVSVQNTKAPTAAGTGNTAVGTVNTKSGGVVNFTTNTTTTGVSGADIEGIIGEINSTVTTALGGVANLEAQQNTSGPSYTAPPIAPGLSYGAAAAQDGVGVPEPSGLAPPGGMGVFLIVAGVVGLIALVLFMRKK